MMRNAYRTIGAAVAAVVSLEACAGNGASGGGAMGYGGGATPAVAGNVESASAGFASVGATCARLVAVGTDRIPIASSKHVCLDYRIGNTSMTAKIGSVFIELPAFDINDLAATWRLAQPFSKIALTGSGSAGCAVVTGPTHTFEPVPGATNGQIEIGGCAIAPGQVLDVRFQAFNSREDNTYDFGSSLESPSGTPASPAWIGATELLLQYKHP